MQFRHIFKYNPNHDSATGEFSEGGGGSVSGGTHASVNTKVRPLTPAVAKAPFRGVNTSQSFQERADELERAAGKPNWERSDDPEVKKDYAALNGGEYGYFGSGYDQINGWLRNVATTNVDVTDKSGHLAGVIQRMDQAFEKYGVTIPHEVQLFRGVDNPGTKSSEVDTFLSALDKLKPGDKFMDNAFVSTTPVPGNIMFGKHVMRITTRQALKALLRGRAGENEVLFQRGRHFTFRGKSTRGGFTYYDVDMD